MFAAASVTGGTPYWWSVPGAADSRAGGTSIQITSQAGSWRMRGRHRTAPLFVARSEVHGTTAQLTNVVRDHKRDYGTPVVIWLVAFICSSNKTADSLSLASKAAMPPIA